MPRSSVASVPAISQAKVVFAMQESLLAASRGTLRRQQSENQLGLISVILLLDSTISSTNSNPEIPPLVAVSTWTAWLRRSVSTSSMSAIWL